MDYQPTMTPIADLVAQVTSLTTFGKLTNRDYQEVAYQETVKYLISCVDPGVVKASVGAGKTIMIAALCKHVTDRNGKVMVLSRQGEIIEQDSEDCWSAGVRNSLYSASLGIKSSVYPVIMGTEGTVWRSLEQDMMYDGVIDCDFTSRPKKPSKLHDYKPDLLLIDECHMVDYENDDSQYMKIIKELLRRNPKLRIIGYTGTDYRGIKPIIGSHESYLWKHKLVDISREYLTDCGFLMPITFGTPAHDLHYDLSKFEQRGYDGTQDYTLAELREMEKEILKDKTTTQRIMRDVVRLSRDRNAVMITCAGKKHCQEAASELPEGSYAIITDDVPTKKRREMLKKCASGEIKYLLQVGCLTTGYNNPLIDTLIILRKIGSLTLLEQLVGRGLRLLKPEHESAGIVKRDCLVLDYSDTMREMGELFESQLLEEAELDRAKKQHETIQCPRCETENSKFARRCIGRDSAGMRCDFFWKSRVCEDQKDPATGRVKVMGCGAENDIAARECRCCGATLIDPNDRLSGKHYTDADLKPVIGFNMIPCKNDGVLVVYKLPDGEEAKEFFSPFSSNQVAKRIWRSTFVANHALTSTAKQMLKQAGNAGMICAAKNELDVIGWITHRINDKGKIVINRRIPKDNY